MNHLYVLESHNTTNSHNTTRIAKSLFTALCVLLIILYAALSPITVSAHTLTDEENVQLQKIALAEAGTEGAWGMALVMQAVLNRVDSPDFPDTVWEVITQENQFEAYSKGTYDEMEPTEDSLEALNLLPSMRNNGQLYFEVSSNDSWHSRNLEFVCEYRRHSFYKPKS